MTSGRSFDWVYRFWHSPDRGHEPEFQDSGYSGVDRALDQLRLARTEPEIREAIGDLRGQFYQDAPAAFLAWIQNSRAVDSRFDVGDRSDPEVFTNLWRWRTCRPGRRPMRGITGRFVLLIATAAVLPLVGYGLWSVKSLGAGTEKSVTLGNQAVAEQIAGRVKLYFDNNVRVLTSIGAELQSTQLQIWQQERVLRNHVLDFREFREITVFDGSGRVRVTSRVGKTVLTVPEAWRGRDTTGDAFYVATPHMDADALPTTTIAVPLENAAWIVAEISLEELWRTVDRIRVGTEGYALLHRPAGQIHRPWQSERQGTDRERGDGRTERAEAGRIGTPQHLVDRFGKISESP